jgi:hypothetical protein
MPCWEAGVPSQFLSSMHASCHFVFS